MTRHVTIDGYVVVAITRTGERIGIAKAGKRDVACWLPRDRFQDGDLIEVGSTDLVLEEWLAEREGLDY